MSNTSTPPLKSGTSRRRKSSGGSNRSRSSSGRSSHRSQQSEEYRPKGPRPPRNAPVVQLSWWQKFLQAIRLYKAPVPTAKKTPSAPRAQSRAKSNTRNARTAESAETSKKRGSKNSAKTRGGDPSTVESARVYVGNLSYDATEHDLEELFKGIGPVRSVEIVYNRATHRSKGYAFVEMLHRDDAVRSVEVLHDQPFMGRNMIVSGAKSRGAEEEESFGSDEALVVAPVPASAVVNTPSVEEKSAQA